MEHEERGKRTYPVNAIRVCIDECNGDLKGRIYSKMREEVLMFENCGEMFLRADELFDECGYPQTFQEKRNFLEQKSSGRYARPQIRRSDEEVVKQTGKCRTVDIIVQSRRRAGWQGIIMEDGKKSAKFQSEMELLKCLGMEIRK